MNCSLYPVQEIGQRPYWWFSDVDENGNVKIEYADFNDTTQEFLYDSTMCIWKNTLTIYNFSDELAGTYSCGFYNHIINQTLKLLDEGTCSITVVPTSS